MCSLGVFPLSDQSLGPSSLTRSLVPDITYHLRECLQALQVCRTRDYRCGPAWADPSILRTGTTQILLSNARCTTDPQSLESF